MKIILKYDLTPLWLIGYLVCNAVRLSIFLLVG